MVNRRDASICLIAAFLVIGCSNQQVKDLSKPTKTVTWKELQALQAPEVNMGLVMSAQRGDAAGIKKAATDPKLSELVDEFEKAPIPSQFASPAREKAKTKVVTGYKSLIVSAKGSGSPKELKDTVMSIQEGISEMTSPDLK